MPAARPAATPASAAGTLFVPATSPLVFPVGGANVTPAFGDLDGDGDLDMLAGSELGTFAYHENLGDASFGPQRAISTQADGARSVHAIDLDGDGDVDVLSASYSDDKIAWYENLGGGTFGAQQVLTTVAKTGTGSEILAGALTVQPFASRSQAV